MSKEKEFYDFYMTVRKRNHLRRELHQTEYETKITIFQEREGQDKKIIDEAGEDSEEIYDRVLYQLRHYDERRRNANKKTK